MRLKALTYDGHPLTNFIVKIKRPYFLTPIQSQWSPRGGNTFDFFSGIQSGHVGLTLEFAAIGENWREDKAELQGWLSDDRDTPKEIVAVDEDDPDLKTWVVEAVPETGTLKNAREFPVVFSLTRADWPLWKTENLINESWDVTASGDTFSFDVAGNHKGSKPIISITPNVSKTGDYAYKIWRPVFNPTDSPWHDIPYDLAEDTPGTVAFDTAALINNVSKSNQVNHVGGYSSSALSIAVDTAVGGGLNTGGGMCYIESTGEQIYYTDITAGVMTIYDDGAGTTGRGWGGTTADTIADNDVLTESLMMANGYDLRVVDQNGNEVDCWFEGINDAVNKTRAWINVTCEDRIQLTLDQIIADSGAVTKIKVKKNPDNLAALRELPSQYMVLIDDEPFVANATPNAKGVLRSVDLVTYELIGTKRVYAKYGETIASHAKGATINYVPVYYWIVYGNPFGTAQIVDDTKKPMIDLATSTNLNLKWNSSSGFRDESALRSMEFKLNILNTTSKKPVTSRIYTATHVDDADPATVAGLAAINQFKNNRWQVENIEASIDFPTHPAGYSNIVITASKHRADATWIKVMAIQKSTDGKTWTTVWNEATPASTSWVTFSTLSASLGSSPVYTKVRFYMSGSVGPGPSSENDVEITSANMTVISSRILNGKMRPAIGNYHFNLILNHTQSGASIVVNSVFATGDTLVIDCERQKAYREDDKKPIPLGAGSSFPELSTGQNDWTYTDENTVDVTVDFDYYGYAWLV